LTTRFVVKADPEPIQGAVLFFFGGPYLTPIAFMCCSRLRLGVGLVDYCHQDIQDPSAWNRRSLGIGVTRQPSDLDARGSTLPQVFLLSSLFWTPFLLSFGEECRCLQRLLSFFCSFFFLSFLGEYGIVALVRKKRATRQRGLKLRLRDLGKIWVLALAPRSRPLQSSTLRYLKAAPVTRSLFSHRRGAARPNRK